MPKISFYKHKTDKTKILVKLCNGDYYLSRYSIEYNKRLGKEIRRITLGAPLTDSKKIRMADYELMSEQEFQRLQKDPQQSLFPDYATTSAYVLKY